MSNSSEAAKETKIREMKISSELLFPTGFGYEARKETFDDPDMFSAYLKEIKHSITLDIDFNDYLIVEARIKIPVRQTKNGKVIE